MSEEIEKQAYRAPEQYNPFLLLPRKREVLVLASYCGDENPGCDDCCPCNECLRMCNIAEVEVGVEHVIRELGEEQYIFLEERNKRNEEKEVPIR